MEVFFIFLETR